MTLQQWIDENELVLLPNDREFVADILDAEGITVENPEPQTPWLWIGEGVVIETNTAGTRVNHNSRWTVTTRTGHYEIRESDDGMTSEDAALYVAGLDWPVHCVDC